MSRQTELISILESFIVEVKENPEDLDCKRKIIRELKRSDFKVPWSFKWWKDKKREEVKAFKFNLLKDPKKLKKALRWNRTGAFDGYYYCGTCHEHTGRLTLQHIWHPTPIREQMGDRDVSLRVIREYFIENMDSLIEEQRNFENSMVILPVCENKICGGTRFEEKKKPKWKSSRMYCSSCNKRPTNDELPPKKMRWIHPISGEPIDREAGKKLTDDMNKKWLREHVALIVEPYASDAVIIKFLKEKIRYLSLNSEDYKYACKKCSYKEDIAIIKGTAYTKDKNTQHIIERMFFILQASKWNFESLDKLIINWDPNPKPNRKPFRSKTILRKRHGL